MKNKKTLKFVVLTMLFTSALNAVNLSSNGHGQALIFPYYTVNNGLNTVYSIVNTTNEPKAIKIVFYEGEGGLEVLDFNVYLSAHDMWTSSLTMGQSTIGNHGGEPVPYHFINDNSCAPYLSEQGQQFLPFVIDTDYDPNNHSLARSTDGFFVVLEMGVVTDDDHNSATALTHDETGTPNDCEQLQNAWNGGYWMQNSENDISQPTGGLTGSAAILDSQNGISYSYDAVTLKNFWQEVGLHTDPGSLYPNLSNAEPIAHVLVNGEIQTSTWSTGYEAVSAVLMQSQIFNEFDFDDSNLSKTEWVLTFPTKQFHVNNGFLLVPPFSSVWDGLFSCDEFEIDFKDRNNRYFSTVGNPEPPPDHYDQLCYQANVIEFLIDTSQFAPDTHVLGSGNLISFAPDNNSIEETSGWALIDFEFPNQIMMPQSGPDYVGLPVVGFKIQRITNNNAQPGLIAQYGRVAVHKGYLFNTPEVNAHE